MSTVTVQLSKPIKEGDKEITSLTFREATVGDACAADLVEGEFQKTAAILAGMADVSLPALRQIPLREFNEIVKKVSVLMGESEAAA